MLNKKMKVSSVILLVIMLLFTVSNFAYAANIPDINENSTFMSSQIASILGIIRWVGYAIAVGMAMILGIKYVTSSPDGKAEIKKTATIYVGGIVLIAGASTIVGAISDNLGMNG